MKYEYSVFDLRVDQVPPVEKSKAWMEETLKKIGANVLGYLSKEFKAPDGNPAYTQLWVLAESHAVIHTSPEEHWVEVVFAFCKDIPRTPLSRAVREFWKPKAVEIQTMTGAVPGRGWKKGLKAPYRAVEGLGEDWKYLPDPMEKLLYRTKSPYQEITLTQLPDNEIALYLDGGIQFVTGYDDEVYHWTLGTAPALMVGNPKNALILGGGDGLVARNLLEFDSIKKITQVELDPIMASFSAGHPIMKILNKGSYQSPKMDLKIMDARKFVASKPKEKYDLILVDFTDPLDASMADLYSSPFYGNLYDHLDPQKGVMAVQSSAAFSDVDDSVRKNLMKATNTLAKPLRFKGKWMADGTIVCAGKGVRHEFKMPDGYEALPPKQAVREMPPGMTLF